MRWRYRDADPVAQAMLEATSYRRSMFRFMGATAADPDILTTFDIDDSSTVVDAGAFGGTWASDIDNRYGASVHAFEPAPDALDDLEERLNDTRVAIHPFALGRSDREAALVLGGVGSSVTTAEAVPGSVPIQVREVAAVFDELGLDEIDLLKLNVEGSEYDILDRLDESDWLARTRILLIQFHEWHPDAHRRRRRNRRALKQAHTEVWNYPWIWEMWSRA